VYKHGRYGPRFLVFFSYLGRESCPDAFFLKKKNESQRHPLPVLLKKIQQHCEVAWGISLILCFHSRPLQDK
jgi:hypothetical protein